MISVIASMFGRAKNLVGLASSVASSATSADSSTSEDVCVGAFCKFVDGMKRLVQPALQLGIIGLVVWCVFDPVAYTTFVTAMSKTPTEMWVLITTVVMSFIGQRTIKNYHESKAAAAVTVATATTVTEIATVPAKTDEFPNHDDVFADMDSHNPTLEQYHADQTPAPRG